jgi:hypothetical protein
MKPTSYKLAFLLLSNDIDSFTAYYDIEVAHEIRMLLIG